MKINDEVCDFLELFEFFAEFRKICYYGMEEERSGNYTTSSMNFQKSVKFVSKFC